jgi:hypothetical protein
MFTHTVLFKLKDPDRAEEVALRLRRMPAQIPTLQSIEVGVDMLRTPRAFDLALITRFTDQEGYESYRDHPNHLVLLDWIKPLVAQSVVADWSG